MVAPFDMAWSLLKADSRDPYPVSENERLEIMPEHLWRNVPCSKCPAPADARWKENEFGPPLCEGCYQDEQKAREQ